MKANLFFRFYCAITLSLLIPVSFLVTSCSDDKTETGLIDPNGTPDPKPDPEPDPEPVPLDGKIEAYPAVPGLVTSEDFTVTANNVDIWTESLVTELPTSSSNEQDRSFVGRVQSYLGTQRVAYARFSTTGGTRIQVKVKNNVSKCIVRPISRNIAVSGIGTKTLTFDIDGPENLYIEIDNLPELMIFADKPETDIPDPNDPNVHYYEAGKIHDIGQLKITGNNQIVYIAAGALVKGCIRLDNAKSGTRIYGRGILDATVRGGDGNCIYSHYSNGPRVEDILIRTQSRAWMCYVNQSTNITFSNVKITGFGANNDGIDLQGSRNCTIDGCFIRTTDDCIAIKTTGGGATELNNTVKNSTMYGIASSDGITLGFETKGPCRKVTVTNCDIIGGRGSNIINTGHSAFSLICDGAGPMEEIKFEDIRVEEKVYDSNFAIIITDGKQYVTGTTPGAVKGITIKNVHWAKNTVPMCIYGYDINHKVSDVLFDGCTVGGTKLSTAEIGKIQINEFTENIRFR